MKKRVLLVEDDPDMRALNRTMLERGGGFEIVGEAVDGASGLVLAARLRPDLVLLDILMPGVNGFDVLVEMRRILPDARIVVLSMLDEGNFAARARALGADAFIDKSLPASRFLAMARGQFESVR